MTSILPRHTANRPQLRWGPLRTLNPSVAEIRAVVADNDKQRFTLKPAPATTGAAASDDARDWLVRANQGHSIALASEALLAPLTADGEGDAAVPDVVVHGTYLAFWPAIEASGGLRPMGRTHVHCAAGEPGPGSAVVSGMRRDAELLVRIDAARSARDGALRWWRSDNGVLLTEGDAAGLVPARYFRQVVGRAQGVGVLWQDGVKVADLPDGLDVRVPRGKEAGRGRGGADRGRGRGRGAGGRGRGRGWRGGGEAESAGAGTAVE